MEVYDLLLDKYIDEIVNDIELVVGEIYLITNKITNKKYVGQTMSHHKNHSKYRPYGYKSRFNSHISESRRDKDKKNYLKQSMRKYGEDKFGVQLIKRCPLEMIDDEEQYCIKKYNTLYPNGYNLTTGGKSNTFIPVKFKNDEYVFNPKPLYRSEQSEETREKISEALVKSLADSEVRAHRSKMAQDQHMIKKLDLFKNCKVEENYIKYLSKKKGRYVVTIDNIKTTFWSIHETDNDNKQRAIDFIKCLSMQRHDQIAGTPLEL
jgi:hypothetical protein